MPPDLEKYKAFAQQIEHILQDKDAKRLAEHIDGSGFVERMVDRLAREWNAPIAAQDAFRNGALSGGKEYPGQALAQVLLRDTAKYHGHRLLRVREVHGEVRALFRVRGSGGGFDHCDFVLRAGSDGKLRIHDYYILSTGELISETMYRTMIATLGKPPPWVKEGQDVKQVLDDIESLKYFTAAFRNKKHEEVLERWLKLPERFRKDKAIFLFRVRSAASLQDHDEKGYLKVIDEFKQAFPNDPALDLITLDGLLLSKKYPEYYNALDRLNQSVGGDPYLEVMRARVLCEEGKFDDARTAIRRAIQAERDLWPAYWTKIDISLRSKSFDETAQALREIEEQFDYYVADLTQDMRYGDFVKSPAYAKWMAERKKKE